MVCKDPEKRKEYMREYARKNRERIAEYKKEYAKLNKDKIAEYEKKRYENNKQYYQQKHKTYREEHKDELKQKKADYYKTPNGIKSRIINKWKDYGIISNDFDTLYDLYINTDKCMYCEKSFADSYYRCLDHDHETGLYRAVLCRSCNVKDVLNPKL